VSQTQKCELHIPVWSTLFNTITAKIIFLWWPNIFWSSKGTLSTACKMWKVSMLKLQLFLLDCFKYIPIGLKINCIKNDVTSLSREGLAQSLYWWFSGRWKTYSLSRSTLQALLTVCYYWCKQIKFRWRNRGNLPGLTKAPIQTSSIWKSSHPSGLINSYSSIFFHQSAKMKEDKWHKTGPQASPSFQENSLIRVSSLPRWTGRQRDSR